MTESDKKEYIALISEMLANCLEEGSKKHGMIILSNEETDVLTIYSINAEEEILPAILASASQVVLARQETSSKDRTIN